jgi:hypothetical protein
VASDDRFELTALQVGDQVCTKLEETTVPVTIFFAANCWASARFTASGIVDFYPLDLTDTNLLIIAVIDSPSATAVRISSPDGESVVVPTGPVKSTRPSTADSSSPVSIWTSATECASTDSRSKTPHRRREHADLPS